VNYSKSIKSIYFARISWIDIPYCINFAAISNWGALIQRAEIILIEPAPGNAGEGNVEKLDCGGLKTHFNLPEFNLKESK